MTDFPGVSTSIIADKEFEFESGFYAQSASEVIFRART